MKAVDHNRRVGEHLVYRRTIAIPDVGSDRLDLGTDGGRDSLELRDNGGFQAIG